MIRASSIECLTTSDRLSTVTTSTPARKSPATTASTETLSTLARNQPDSRAAAASIAPSSNSASEKPTLIARRATLRRVGLCDHHHTYVFKVCNL